ncbi:MAG: helix-turn-helix transcriptional regulator [Eubacterium sp.]|nr:helix-turn-helix transcriptional regulator [Eubacterium sp.]
MKEKTGKTFNQILTEIRLQKAKEYLMDTELTIDIIAELCGFNSSSYLSKTFKKVYCVSPSLYRETQETLAAQS